MPGTQPPAASMSASTSAATAPVAPMPVSLTRRGWSFVLSAIGLWLAWFAIGLRDLWYLVALLGAMVALAPLLALALARLARFDVRLSVTDPTPAAGERVTLTAVIRHRLPLALRYRIVWRVGGDVSVPVDAGRVRRNAVGARRDDAVIARIDWHAARRGPAEARIAALLVLDPLGLVLCRVRTATALELVVLPRLLPELTERFDEATQDSGVEELSSSRAEPHARVSWQDTHRASSRPVLAPLGQGSPGGAVREYRNGDPQRQIHWKQSARQGELLVNLHETSEAVDRALLLVTSRDAYGTETGFELAVSAAATLAVRWLRRGSPVRLRLGDELSAVCRTETDALRQLARATREAGSGLDEAPAVPASAPPAAGRMLEPANAVVTGTVTARLGEHLRRMPHGGILLALRRTPEARVPGRWHEIEIPREGDERHTDADPAFTDARPGASDV